MVKPKSKGMNPRASSGLYFGASTEELAWPSRPPKLTAKADYC